MTIPLYHVDAFTDRPFAGNPAAVCILPSERPEAWMQQVRAEMNLSETAFVQKQGDGFRLRWFTPKVEVDLCGHATLVAAFDLGRFRRLVDLGGATGHLAVAACQRYPALRAVVFDLSEAVPLAQEMVAASPVPDLVGVANPPECPRGTGVRHHERRYHERR